jgi:quercetin dioxygenase-like cupin family protein
MVVSNADRRRRYRERGLATQKCAPHQATGRMKMPDGLANLRFGLAVGAIAGLATGGVLLGLGTAAQAVELDKTAVVFTTPDQFVWRDPSGQAEINRTILHGEPDKAGSLYIYMNKFKPNRFGNPHFHPNDRFITVIDGTGWKGTGPVVDPEHAMRLPKGSFMIDHAFKVHWDGTKDDSSAYLIAGYGPDTNHQLPHAVGTFPGLDPGAVTAETPDQLQWKDNGGNRTVTLVGDPEKPGLYIQMLTWLKGNHFSRPHFHPNDRFITVLSGTWWVGTGNTFDPEHLTVPMKPGTFVTHFAKGVHWDGAKDEDTTLLIIGEGPATNTLVEEAK